MKIKGWGSLGQSNRLKDQYFSGSGVRFVPVSDMQKEVRYARFVDSMKAHGWTKLDDIEQFQWLYPVPLGYQKGFGRDVVLLAYHFTDDVVMAVAGVALPSTLILLKRSHSATAHRCLTTIVSNSRTRSGADCGPQRAVSVSPVPLPT